MAASTTTPLHPELDNLDLKINRLQQELAEAELAVEGALAGYTYNALGD